MIDKILNKIFKSFLENRLLSRWFILFIDIVIIVFAALSAYIITLQIYKNLKVVNHPDLTVFLSITIIINLICFLLLKTYKGIVRYSTIHELQRILISLLLSNLFIFLCLYKLIGPSGSVAMAYCTTLFMMSLIGLYGFRIIVVYTYHKLTESFGTNRPIPVFLWGIDEENLALAQTLNGGKNKFKVKGFIIKEPKSKLSGLINLAVIHLKTPQDLLKYKITNVLFSNEKILKEQTSFVETMIRMNIRIYITQQMKIKNVSQLSETNNHQIRPLQIEDLLGRSEINISMEIIMNHITGKTILVTGAAGSIGSEIVRQLACFEPKNIICLDQAETPLHDLTLELEKKFPSLNFTTILGDIRNKNRISKVFEKFKPNVIYHAAAYKHVPMMEKNPSQAIITNVLGSKILVDLSIEHAVEMFVMVSTDKAVNPTNIMGASKRIAEIYVQSSANNRSKNIFNTKFVTTRFGNVLGSNGSVIPLFKSQIEKGGPITVTDKNITRYFMTIPEACRLVLEASVIGDSGYIYVFDMGKPVKIIDLATKMIELAGFVPEKDIKIEITGLRPGEKLYEELLNDSEISEQTSHPKVMKAKVREYSYEEIFPLIDNIVSCAIDEEKYKTVTLMKELVPEFISNNSEFQVLDQEKLEEII